MKIVIADDEYYARKALIKKIEKWNHESFTVAGDFENGQEVLAYLSEGNRPDMLLTDIRMPVMDGLTLSEMVASQYPFLNVAIISGYSDFEYARKAITFGVKDYLLKPVDPEELKQLLLRMLENKKNREQALAEKMLEYLSIDDLNRNASLKERFCTPVFKNRENLPFQLILVQSDPEPSSPDGFVQELYGLFPKRDVHWFYFRRFGEYAGFLFDTPEGETPEHLKIILSSLIRQKKETQNVSLCIGLSQKHRGQDAMKKAYHQAVYAMNQRLLHGWRKIYEYEEAINPVNYFTPEKENQLKAFIRSHAAEKAASLAAGSLKLVVSDVYSLYVTIMSILNVLYQLFCDRNKQEAASGVERESNYILFNFRTDLYRFKNQEELEKYLKNLIVTMCRDQEDEGQKYHETIAEILDYIEKNYQYDISLQELSTNRFFMNPSYVSRLFKNEVGVTFSKYLVDFRIRKAEELLKDPSIKITEVSLLSGYNDVSHFIQTFKKKRGCTPEEYRNKKIT